MFDNDGKKLLKRKAKLPGLSLTQPTLQSDTYGDIDKPTTVYEELKLTQILQQEIDGLMIAIDDRSQMLE